MAKDKMSSEGKNPSEIPAGFIVFWLEGFILKVNHLPKQITVVIHMSSAKTLENIEKTKKPFTLDSDHLLSYPYIFSLFLKQTTFNPVKVWWYFSNIQLSRFNSSFWNI